MADPARQLGESDQPAGNVDSAPAGRPDLRLVHSGEGENSPPAGNLSTIDQQNDGPIDSPGLNALEGGGETSPAQRDWYAANNPQALNQAEQNGGNPTQHEKVVGHGYNPKPHYELPSSFFSKLGKRRGWLIGAGGGGVLVLIAILAFFSIIGNFKLDFLISNIDQRVFLRFTSVADRRSSKWVQSYLTIRMTEWGDGRAAGQADNNQFFRSNRVDTNSPVRDWYRTLRTSKFEQELFDKLGIKFVSVLDENGKARTGYININGEKPINVPMTDADMAKISQGDIEAYNRFSRYFDSDRFDNDRQARRAIKRVVNDNTRFFQILERRMYRKAIQNMTGVRSWRFFEDTRNKVDEKKINIRNKILLSAIPKSTLAGKFLRCMMGMATCQKSVDPANDQYRATVTDITGDDKCKRACEDAKKRDDIPDYGSDPPSTPDNPIIEKEEVPNPDCSTNPACSPKTILRDKPNIDFTPREAQMFKFMQASISKIAGSVFIGISLVNIIDLLEMLDSIDNALSGGLSKMVAVARGTQAMGLYQVMKTSRDQHNSGNVNAAEYNQFNQVISAVAASEGWTKVIVGKGDTSKISNTAESQEYCGKENQDFITDPNNAKEASKQFHYLCPNKQIGGGSNAANIESAYKNFMGTKVLSAIADAWRGLKDANGGILGKAIAFTYKLFETLLNKTANALITIIRFAGLGESLKKLEVAMEGLVQKIATFLGAGPILNENDPAGVFFNWMVQGGAYTAENVARYNGAKETTAETQALAQHLAAGYRDTKQEEASIFERYLSTSNPDSVSSKSLMALSEEGPSGVTAKFLGLGNIFKSFASSIAKPFQKPANAAEFTGYEGSNFAGIQTFDYPQKCLDLDPLTAGPLDGTNIFQVLDDFDIKADPSDWGSTKEQWEVVNDSEDFYDYLYKKVENIEEPDTITLKVYNCNLLDTSVRGGLGYLYGYTKDNGLDENTSSTTGGGADQSPGDTSTIKNQSWKACITKYAPGLDPTPTPGNEPEIPEAAIPNDGRQYFGQMANDGDPRFMSAEEAKAEALVDQGPGEYIRVKYRNPPSNGNTVWIPTFSC